MKRLNAINYNKASNYILNNARNIEKSLFSNTFIQPCPDKVIENLALYQNDDGGFGNALEPDFRLPNSSSQATLYALRILDEFGNQFQSTKLINRALEYLMKTYNHDIKGWESVPIEVNRYSHAPWWSYNDKPEYLNGNPSIELIGYILKYGSSDDDYQMN